MCESHTGLEGGTGWEGGVSYTDLVGVGLGGGWRMTLYLTCFFSSSNSVIVGSYWFSGSAAAVSGESGFSLVFPFLFSFFLSFSCLSFFSDLSLRCFRFDSLVSDF